LGVGRNLNFNLLNMKTIILTTVLLAVVSIASISLAQSPVAPTITIDLWSSNSILTKVLNWFFGIVILIAAIMLVWAGYNYVTSAGNEDKMKTALNTVIYALVGVAIVLLAKGLVYLICNFVSQTTCQWSWF